MVNFISLFCPELKKLLKPIFDLNRKNTQFICREEQQNTFVEVKRRLPKPPVLHLPEHEARSHLYSNTNKHFTGSAIFPIQKGKKKIIACAVKDCLGQLFNKRTGIMWFSNKYSRLFSPIEKSRFWCHIILV